MASSCITWASAGDGCTCRDAGGNVFEYQPTGSLYHSNTDVNGSIYHQCCIANGVHAGCATGSVKPTLTGHSAVWRKQSGDDTSGEIFGLTTQQALIAVGVGVAAYFIIKKVK